MSTIFLATDGRHVTVSRDDNATLSDETVAGIKAQGLKGFVANMSGSYHTKRAPTLTMLRPIEGTHPDQWDAAVAAFLALRLK